MADKLQPTIDDKFRDRETNTQKRLAQANHARFEGARLERTQKALYKLADLADNNNMPDNLKRIKSKKHVYDLMAETREPVNNGYHQYIVGTGEPYKETPETLALWSLLDDETPEQKQEKELQRKIEGLQFSNIAGYFPTPDKVISLMLDYADINDQDRVLEPSAGSGAIADAVKPLCKVVEVLEVNYTLREILQAKGHSLVGQDFMQWESLTPCHDKILMNPPFENLQDIEHIQHAYYSLAGGGRLVSIMSSSAFFRSDAKSKAFQAWFDDLSGERIDLPENSFKESGTNVNTIMVVIDRN